MGAMAPVILRKRLIAPAVSTRNGKILLTLGTRNIKILNTPLFSLDVLERYHCIDWNCLFQYLCDKLQVDGEVDVIKKKKVFETHLISK